MPSRTDIQNARKQLGLDRLPAILGDGSGQPRTSEGFYWVRKIEADGLAAAVKLPLAAGVSITVADGTPCQIGWNEDRQQVIYPASAQTLKASGVNPLTVNPLDGIIQKPVISSDFTPFLCKRHGDTVNFPLTVVVYVPPVVNADSTVVLPNALSIALASEVPTTGLRCFAVVFWLNNNTLEVQSSTPVSMLDPLTNLDLEECVAASTAGSIPVWAWILQDAQTELSADPAKNMDMRQFINTAGGGSVPTDNISLTEYIDLVEWASPTSPAANTARIFSEDFNGFSVVKMRLADDTEIMIGSGRYFIARNLAATTINAGAIVRRTGTSNAATTLPTVQLADADSPALMPADGIAIDTAATNTNLRVVTEGYAVVDTTGFADGNNMFVSGTAGAWVTSAPTFPSADQRIGIVILGGLASGLVYILPRQVDGLMTRVLNTTLKIGGTAPGAIIEFWSNIGSQYGKLQWIPTGSPHTLTLPDTTANLQPFTSQATAPTVNEDSGDGYVIGHHWINTATDKEYVLTDTTVGAAVWVETTAAGGSGDDSGLFVAWRF